MPRKRRYSCSLPVDQRWFVCGQKKASKTCLTKDLFGRRCSHLKISVK